MDLNSIFFVSQTSSFILFWSHFEVGTKPCSIVFLYWATNSFSMAGCWPCIAFRNREIRCLSSFVSFLLSSHFVLSKVVSYSSINFFFLFNRFLTPFFVLFWQKSKGLVTKLMFETQKCYKNNVFFSWNYTKISSNKNSVTSLQEIYKENLKTHHGPVI